MLTETHNELVLPDSPVELAALIDAAVVKIADSSLGLLSDSQVVSAVQTLERAWRRADGVNAKLLVEVSDREAFSASGHTSVRRFYAQELRLGPAEAKRREEVAKAIAPMNAMTGEKLPPKREAMANAVVAGQASAEHVAESEAILSKVPHSVSPADLEFAATVLATAAQELAPQDLRPIGQRLLGHLDPDGKLSDDTDRARQRGIIIGRQDKQMMSKISGYLTPELRAKLEVVLHAWAAPGINNPDDEHSPGGSVDQLDDEQRTSLAEAVKRDSRTPGQRNHDAVLAACDWILGHQALGRPDRIPTQVVITVDEVDLARRAGVALTTTGTAVPIGDLVELAAQATPWLEVFANATREVLDFARGRRLASLPQRLAMFGQDRGCTRPGCTEPFIRCQAHHARKDFAEGGLTNLAHLGAACGPDNRNVGTKAGQWETTIIDSGRDAGRVGWRLAGSDGPFRTNPVHHPTEFLRERPPDESTSPPSRPIKLLRSPGRVATDPPWIHTDSQVEGALHRLLDAA